MTSSSISLLGSNAQNPLLSIIYPTYKRENRVARIIDHYSGINCPLFEVVISNNDKQQKFTKNKCIPGFIFTDNIVSSRIGDNIVNGLRHANGRYYLLMSDEDLVIGIAELCDWLTRLSPGMFLLPIINTGSIERKFTEGTYLDIFRKNSYLSGIGFRSNLAGEGVCNDIVGMDNNDYAHLMLVMSAATHDQSAFMPRFSFVFREEVYHEGKADYFEARSEWFGWIGRSKQKKNLLQYATRLKSANALALAKSFVGKGSFSNCFRIYGIRETFAEAASIGELWQAAGIYFRCYLPILALETAAKPVGAAKTTFKALIKRITSDF